MSKYHNLTLHLAGLDSDEWKTTFGEVELILGTALPDSARKHRPWWANDGYAQSTAWLGAGWKTANVDMANEKVTFVRVGADSESCAASKLTIAEAKAGLAANFNVPVSAIQITIQG